MPNQTSPKDKAIDVEELLRERDELKARVAALSGLIEVGAIITSTLNLDDLIRLVMEKAQKVMHAEASSVMIINENRNVLECPVALGEAGDKIEMIELQLGQGIAGSVATSGIAEVIPDAQQDPRFNSAIDKETGFTTKSILAVPLIVKDRIIGIAEVINRIDGEPFDNADLELFIAFCRSVALAIENARMVQLQLEKQRLDQQLEAAQSIQQSFMPENIPTIEGQSFSIAAESLAARSVGGDFYDFIDFDEDRMGLIIGDISGKGVPAALFMARMISDFRLYTQEYRDAGILLSDMNNTLQERSQRGMFVTSLYGILNTKSGCFTFANAGHIPLIHVKQAANTSALVEDSAGVPLGILADITYEESEITLSTGDYLIMITDGVTEAKAPDSSEYSLERVLELFNNSSATPEKLIEYLMDDIRKFTGDEQWRDDVTIVVLKWQ
ncbi:MAG: PP2C family protein-serine/threonine phosphatase [Calditrichia bacterium]